MEDLAKVAGAAVLALVIGAAVAGYLYFSAEQQTVPITGREQRVAMTEDQQEKLGLEAFQQLLAENRGRVVSGPQAELVRTVGERIAAVADDPGFEWEYALFDSPLVNAFCLPGGKVGVYTGLLPVAENEAGLAAVMAHEVAHAIAQHGAERALQQQLSGAVAAALSLGLSGADPAQRAAVLGLFGAGAQYGVLLPFGRDQESEADRIGLIYMARAGYDPREAVRFWERMAAAQAGPQPPEYVSTHPSHERRVADLQSWMPEALAEYEKARRAQSTAAPRGYVLAMSAVGRWHSFVRALALLHVWRTERAGSA